MDTIKPVILVALVVVTIAFLAGLMLGERRVCVATCKADGWETGHALEDSTCMCSTTTTVQQPKE